MRVKTICTYSSLCYKFYKKFFYDSMLWGRIWTKQGFRHKTVCGFHWWLSKGFKVVSFELSDFTDTIARVSLMSHNNLSLYRGFTSLLKCQIGDYRSSQNKFFTCQEFGTRKFNFFREIKSIVLFSAIIDSQKTRGDWGWLWEFVKIVKKQWKPNEAL